MNEKEIEEYLKNYLTIEVRKSGGDYGSKSYSIIELKLKGEVISDTYLDD